MIQWQRIRLGCCVVNAHVFKELTDTIFVTYNVAKKIPSHHKCICSPWSSKHQ